MDSFLQIIRTNISVGLNKPVKLFQISDMHMACLDNESSEIDINDHKRFHKQWDKLKRDFAKEANELCDERYDIEPNLIFERLIDRAIELGSNAIVLSGDIFDRITDSNIRYYKDLVAKIPIPIIYCPGNHDWINESGERKNQYDRLKEIVKNPECDSFDFGELTVVTIDNGMKIITDKQLDFLKQSLSEKKHILIVLHAPLNIGKSGKELASILSTYFLQGVDGDCGNAFEFNRLVEENAGKIVAVLAGHIHRFYEGEITGNLKQYTTSSGLIAAGREIIIE